jgi:hypothetical protein
VGSGGQKGQRKERKIKKLKKLKNKKSFLFNTKVNIFISFLKNGCLLPFLKVYLGLCSSKTEDFRIRLERHPKLMCHLTLFSDFVI